MFGSYLLAAHDGADDDGGTLYVLYADTGETWLPVKTASVPQPLEAWAAAMGRAVRRVSPLGADDVDYLRDV